MYTKMYTCTKCIFFKIEKMSPVNTIRVSKNAAIINQNKRSILLIKFSEDGREIKYLFDNGTIKVLDITSNKFISKRAKSNIIHNNSFYTNFNSDSTEIF